MGYLDQQNFCLRCGLDLKKQMAEVAPAVHYFMGGIEVNEIRRVFTSNIRPAICFAQRMECGIVNVNEGVHLLAASYPVWGL